MNPYDAAAPWLKVSRNDISSIRNNLYGPEPNLESAAYNCQQAAEKIIKAILAAGKIRFDKTHYLERLLRLLPQDHVLLNDLRKLNNLTPYAYAFRYPNEDIDEIEALDVPSRGQLEEWLEMIVRILEKSYSYLEELK